MAQFPAEILDPLERLGAASQGDVPALIAEARAHAPGPFADELVFAQAMEAAAERRAAAGDRAGTWWLCCALATLRASALATAQEDAEINAARLFGELPQSPAARAPVPEPARWLVAGAAEPTPAGVSIELARRNAIIHLDRLGAELTTRAEAMRGQADALRRDPSRLQAIEEAIATYDLAAGSTRAALGRVIDHVIARSGNATLAKAGQDALAELDDRAIPALRARTLEARRSLGSTTELYGASVAIEEAPQRPSFAGAAPPSFRGSQGSQAGAPSPGPAPVAIAPSAGPPTREALEASMRTAFEHAWTSPGAESRAAFVQAVRARYELETAAIPDPQARQQALDHYIAHAVAQLPA